MTCRVLIGPVLLAVWLLASTVSAHAQTSSSLTRRLTAVRLQPNERIILDGRLSEEAWRRADPASDFRQQDPQNGEPATEQTEVRVLYDEHRILLGVRCLDSEPARLFGNQMQRDQSLAADEVPTTDGSKSRPSPWLSPSRPSSRPASAMYVNP